MKKTRLFLLPILAMSFMALSSCTKDDIGSLMEYGDSLAAADIHLQSQIDELKNEITKLNKQISDLEKEMNSSINNVRDDYNAKIDTLNQQVIALQQNLITLQTQFTNDKQTIQSDYNTKIDNLKDYIDGKVLELNNKIAEDEQALADLEAKHDADKAALQNDYNSKFETLSATANEMRQQLQNDYNTKISNLNNKLDSDKQELFDDYTAKLAALSESEQEARQALKEDYEEQLALLEAKHDEDVADIEEDYTSKLTTLEETYTADKALIQEDYNTKINNLNNAFNETTASLQAQITANQTALSEFQNQYLNEKAALELDYNTKINNLRMTYEAKVAEIEAEIVLLNSNIDSLETQMATSIAGIQADYNGKINALTARVAELEQKEYHIVTFDTLCDAQIDPAYVLDGKKATKPADPTRPGYTFVNWLYEGEPWVFFGYSVTEDITLTANWEAIDYTVIFQNDDGSVLEIVEEAHYGDSVTYHGDIPSKVNVQDHYIYTFTGWDVSLTNITGNTIAVAQYNEEYAPYVVRFLDESNNILYSTPIREGETATYVGVTPTKPDDNLLELQYQFDGWDEISRTDDEIFYKVRFNSCTRGLIFQGNSVYQYVGSKKAVTIPSYWNGVAIKEISEKAFESTTIQSVFVPEGVEKIWSKAFRNCANLSSIQLPDTLLEIGDEDDNYECGVFSGCICLESIAIPNSVTYIGREAFKGCTSLTSITLPNTLQKISSRIFSGCTSLHDIIIPEGVQSIGISSFYDCQSLESINFPSTLTIIYSSAFKGSYELSHIDDCSLALTTIQSEAFYECWHLETFFIPISVTYVGSYAFRFISGLEIYCEAEYKPKDWDNDWNADNVPVYWGVNHVHTFGDWYLADSTTCTYERACSICGYTLQRVGPHSDTCDWFFSSDITSIDEWTTVYGNCSICGELVDERPLSECSDLLTSISIPGSVTSIGDNAFNGFSLLTSIEIPNSVVSIGEAAFKYCSSLQSVSIGSGVGSIGDYSFAYCSSLPSIEIPNSVTSIGAYAFCKCSSLGSFSLPSSVLSIGDKAFSSCTNLTSFTFESTVPPTIGGKIFSTTWYNEDFKIYVPSEAAEAYRAITAEGWQDNALSHIVEY